VKITSERSSSFKSSRISSEPSTFDFGLSTDVVHTQRTFDHDETPQFRNQEIGSYTIVGQIRNRYVILQSDDAVFYIDQHALAERIAFEKMKKEISEGTNLHGELLLQPLTIDIHEMPNIQEKIDAVNAL
jgi:DNA mismatch repair ATPase MutL